MSTDEAGPLSVPDSDVEAGRDTEPDTAPDAEGLPVDVWISANVDRTEEARADGGQPLTPEQIRLRCRHI